MNTKQNSAVAVQQIHVSFKPAVFWGDFRDFMMSFITSQWCNEWHHNCL